MSREDAGTALAVDISVEAEAWGEEAALRPLVERTLTTAADVGRFDLPAHVEVSLLLTDDARIQVLNRVWRGKDMPTNVLSFPAGPEAAKDGLPDDARPLLLGDIVLARETVVREAAAEGKTLEAHVCHLLVHGFLHLLGYDHEIDDAAEEMESLETEILAALGIADPYAEVST
ncbi:MAG: rRNA maturation RNase YbeY [Ancalomicrobiaceae bacterium]|nr:rRNA maturation RNase YbeY [Ancalomicrobiaceae bacterium]